MPGRSMVMDAEHWFALALAALLAAALLLAWRNGLLTGGAKRLTVLVCGGTGVGKSTLIGALLTPSDAVSASAGKSHPTATPRAAIGAPVTRNTEFFQRAGAAAAFYDTRGLEVEDSGKTYLLLLSDLLRLRYGRPPSRQIDLVLMCIAEPTARYDDAHLEIASLCSSLQIPMGIAVTKTEGNEAFVTGLRHAFPTASFIVPVCALATTVGGMHFPPVGLEDLNRLMMGHRAASAAAAFHRARHAKAAARLAAQTRQSADQDTDEAWTALAAAFFRLLLPASPISFETVTGGVARRLRRHMVPGLLRRTFLTKFDDARITGVTARRLLPRILRRFAEGSHIDSGDIDEILSEVIVSLGERRPYRSRIG